FFRLLPAAERFSHCTTTVGSLRTMNPSLYDLHLAAGIPSYAGIGVYRKIDQPEWALLAQSRTDPDDRCRRHEPHHRMSVGKVPLERRNRIAIPTLAKSLRY